MQCRKGIPDPDATGRLTDRELARLKLRAGSLALLIGGFGVHKFVLGYRRAGWIMLVVALPGSLVSFGIASLVMGAIAVVEGLRYLALSPEEFRRLYVDGRREWF
jgi:hypothetical protein